MQHPIRDAADYTANAALIAERLELIRAAMRSNGEASFAVALDHVHDLLETDPEFTEALMRQGCLEITASAFVELIVS